MKLQFVRKRPRKSIEIWKKRRVAYVHHIECSHTIWPNQICGELKLDESAFGIVVPSNDVFNGHAGLSCNDEGPGLRDETTIHDEWLTNADSTGLGIFEELVQFLSNIDESFWVHGPHSPLRRRALQCKKGCHVGRPSKIQQPRRGTVVLHQRKPLKSI